MRLGGPGNFGRVSGAQLGQFRDALLDTFNLARFDEMLQVFLTRKREHIALGNDLRHIVVLVISTAEDEGWTAELLGAARLASPANEALMIFGQQFGAAVKAPTGTALQNTIRAGNGQLDVGPWRARLAEAEGRVCRIEIASAQPPDYGTGFLVAPDVLMTNWHVVESVITGLVPADKVCMRFDYKVLDDGVAVNPGTVHRLAPGAKVDWLLHESPYSAADLSATSAQDAGRDELDFVLLRLGQPAGDESPGAPSQLVQDARPRGWVPLPRVTHGFAPLSSLFILQHPDGKPLKLTLDTTSVQGTNGSGTRVRYTTNTEPGSSGSPCFDANWNLIALHHSGDPRYSKLRPAAYNQGVPVAAIVDALARANKLDLLGAAAG